MGAAEQTSKLMGGVDILVNDAGIAGVTKTTWECTPEEWRTHGGSEAMPSTPRSWQVPLPCLVDADIVSTALGPAR